MDTLKLNQGLTDSHLKELTRWLGEALIDNRLPEAIPGGLEQDQQVRVVFVSVADEIGHYEARSAMGMGLGLAGKKAAQLALESWTYGEISHVKVDVVAEAIPVSEKLIKKNKGLIPDPSLVGVAVEGFEQAWLAEENLRFRLVKKNGGIDYKVLAKNLSHRIHVDKPQKLYLFSTGARYFDGVDNALLIRNHRLPERITPQLCFQRAEAGADYLSRHVRDNGTFVYTYQTGRNREPDDYNIVRHAGTLWSMLDVHKSTKDQRAEAAIHRAASYLRSLIEPHPGYPEQLILNEFGTAKLGANGLGMVALSDYYRLSQDEAVLEDLRGMARWLVATQSEDGQFMVHKMELDTGDIASFLSDYYPGEAILGLMRLYKIDPNPLWKETAAQGARWLINVRDAGKTLDELEHDHWLLYGLNETYREVPENIYLEHTRKLVEAILSTQHQKSQYPDWLGGWYHPPRTTPAATRTEGLAAAYQLLRDFGKPNELEPIKIAFEKGLQFQLQNQLVNEKLMYLPDPKRAHGGFHSNLTNWNVRIDYVQHSISALLAYYRLFQ